MCIRDRAVTINPNKWFGDPTYGEENGQFANGIMTGQMTYRTDGDSGKLSSEDVYKRQDVVNPNVTLLGTTASAVELNIANQALDYRFYVRNFPETREETDRCV